MKTKLQKWVAMIGLMVFCLLAIGGAVAAESRPLPAGASPGTTLGREKENSTSRPNDAGTSAVADGGIASKALAFMEDHRTGLLYGLAVGALTGLAIVGIAAALAVTGPVLIAIGIGGLIAGGLYGLITGAANFDVWDCVLFSVIGAVSSGMGASLAAAGMVGEALAAAKVVINLVGGGVGMMGSYLLHTPDPTLSGALWAFAAGVVTAGVFMRLGAAVGEVLGPVVAKTGTWLRGLFGLGKGALVAGEGAPAGGRPGGEAPAIGGAMVVETNPGVGARANSVIEVPPPSADVAALEAAVPSLGSKLAKVPQSVRQVFGEGIAGLKSAPNKRQYLQELEEAAVWARRNPRQATEVVAAGQGLEDLMKTAKAAPVGKSTTLTTNMEREIGQSKPKGYAAHHIVASNEAEAEEARMILQKLGIDINDSSNGVFLPNRAGIGTTEMYHPSLHTNGYFRAVTARLRGAVSAEDAREILADIAHELRMGTLPK